MPRSKRAASSLRRTCVSKFSAPLPEPSFLGKRIHELIQSGKASSFTDFTLITSDDVKLDTSRSLLQISSPYFDTMLTSEFCEKNMSEVKVTIAAYYLKQVLEFIYVDDCALFRNVSEWREGDFVLKEDVSCKNIAELIELGSTADFLQMPRLVRRCESVVSNAIRQQPHFIPVALQHLYQRRSTWGKRVYREASDRLSCFFKEALLDSFPGCDRNLGCMHFDDVVAEQVFTSLVRNTRSEIPMCLVFKALVIWGSGGTVLKVTEHPHARRDPYVRGDPYARDDPYAPPRYMDPYAAATRYTDPYAPHLHEQGPISRYSVDMRQMVMTSERSTVSKKIAESFDLCSFDGRFLSEIVEQSHLVDPSKFLGAYRQLCLRYEDEKEMKN